MTLGTVFLRRADKAALWVLLTNSISAYFVPEPRTGFFASWSRLEQTLNTGCGITRVTVARNKILLLDVLNPGARCIVPIVTRLCYKAKCMGISSVTSCCCGCCGQWCVSKWRHCLVMAWPLQILQWHICACYRLSSGPSSFG